MISIARIKIQTIMGIFYVLMAVGNHPWDKNKKQGEKQ